MYKVYRIDYVMGGKDRKRFHFSGPRDRNDRLEGPVFTNFDEIADAINTDSMTSGNDRAIIEDKDARLVCPHGVEKGRGKIYKIPRSHCPHGYYFFYVIEVA